MISAVHLFNKMSDLTLTIMVFSLLEERKFKKGDVIMAQSKQAPTNTMFAKFYEMQISKLAQDIKKRKGGGTGGNQSSTNVSQVVGIPKNIGEGTNIPA